MKTLFFFICLIGIALSIPALAADGTWQIVGTISGPGGRNFVDPTGITWANGFIWAIEQHASVAGAPLYKIDPATMLVVEEIDIPISNCCNQGLAWDGQYIWISGDGYKIYRFEPATHNLQHVCDRPSFPEAIGLTFANGTLYCTGWHGNIPPEYILALNSSDCTSSIVGELSGVSNFGLTYDGTYFLACGKDPLWPQTQRQLAKYRLNGTKLCSYLPFDFLAYDLAWDGQYLWVCDYGVQFAADGRILKIELHDDYIQTLLQEFSAEFQRDAIAVRWTLSEMDPGTEFTLFKRVLPGSEFKLIGNPAIQEDGLTFTYLDRSVESQGSYSYRVVMSKGNTEQILFETEPVVTPSLPLVLMQSFPNPFNPGTTIRYTVAETGPLSLAVYDAAGRLVETLMDHELKEAGRYRFEYRLAGASGVYFLRLTSGKQVKTEKIVLLK